MQLSIIIPAYNEERYLPACLADLHAALAANAADDIEIELIVVDNNSTDRTADVARAAGAQVCFEAVNQIARARNTGATAARGDWLMFLDADTEPTPALVGAIFALLRSVRIVGFGSTLAMDGLPRWGRWSLALWNGLSRSCRWAAGALLVCRADAFRAVGGFSERLYAAEEIDLSRRLRRWGRPRGLAFLILDAQPLKSSNRKLSLYSGREITAQFLWLCLWPFGSLRRKAALRMWYDGRR